MDTCRRDDSFAADTGYMFGDKWIQVHGYNLYLGYITYIRCKRSIMTRLYLMHVTSICIHLCPCRRQHVAYANQRQNDVVTAATCIHLYPRVEHCLELISVYMYLPTCRRIQVVCPICIRLHVSGINAT